jgi:hypothetical protein
MDFGSIDWGVEGQLSDASNLCACICRRGYRPPQPEHTLPPPPSQVCFRQGAPTPAGVETGLDFRGKRAGGGLSMNCLSPDPLNLSLIDEGTGLWLVWVFQGRPRGRGVRADLVHGSVVKPPTRFGLGTTTTTTTTRSPMWCQHFRDGLGIQPRWVSPRTTSTYTTFHPTGGKRRRDRLAAGALSRTSAAGNPS